MNIIETIKNKEYLVLKVERGYIKLPVGNNTLILSVRGENTRLCLGNRSIEEKSVFGTDRVLYSVKKKTKTFVFHLSCCIFLATVYLVDISPEYVTNISEG